MIDKKRPAGAAWQPTQLGSRMAQDSLLFAPPKTSRCCAHLRDYLPTANDKFLADLSQVAGDDAEVLTAKEADLSCANCSRLLPMSKPC